MPTKTRRRLTQLNKQLEKKHRQLKRLNKKIAAKESQLTEAENPPASSDESESEMHPQMKLWVDSSIGEFKSNNIVNMFQRQLALLFGHHVGSYVFGDGVILFPRWFKHKYPNLELSRMDRQVGSRHGVMLKNAMVHYYMFDVYR